MRVHTLPPEAAERLDREQVVVAAVLVGMGALAVAPIAVTGIQCFFLPAVIGAIVAVVGVVRGVRWLRRKRPAGYAVWAEADALVGQWEGEKPDRVSWSEGRFMPPERPTMWFSRSATVHLPAALSERVLLLETIAARKAGAPPPTIEVRRDTKPVTVPVDAALGASVDRIRRVVRVSTWIGWGALLGAVVSAVLGLPLTMVLGGVVLSSVGLYLLLEQGLVTWKLGASVRTLIVAQVVTRGRLARFRGAGMMVAGLSLLLCGALVVVAAVAHDLVGMR